MGAQEEKHAHMIWTIIGSVGVGILLLAFFLNIRRKLTESSALYLWMNIIGSGLSAVYAAMSGSIPFVVLEGAWASVAAFRLLRPTKKAPA